MVFERGMKAFILIFLKVGFLKGDGLRWQRSSICLAFNDWEVDLVASFVNALQKEKVSAELDYVLWRGR